MDNRSPNESRASGVLVVVATLNIIFGILGILRSIITLLARTLGYAERFSEQYYAFCIFCDIFVGFAAVLLIAGGVGLFLLAPWGRILSITTAIGYIAEESIFTVVGLIIITQRENEQWAYGFSLGVVVVMLLKFIYPIFLIIQLNRASIKTRLKHRIA